MKYMTNWLFLSSVVILLFAWVETGCENVSGEGAEFPDNDAFNKGGNKNKKPDTSEGTGTDPVDDTWSDPDAGTDADTDADSDTDADTDTDTDSDTDGDQACVDEDNDGWCIEYECDDKNPDVKPFADEIVNGIDDDCDGETDETQSGNPTCGEDNFTIDYQPVKLMILQDMSSSMNSSDKWIQARAALKSMLNNPANAGIEFGFDTFPNASCDASDPVVHDCGDVTAAQLAQDLDLLDPSGGTPFCIAMHNFTTTTYAPKCLSGGSNSYLIVVSDGGDGCTDLSIGCDSGYSNNVQRISFENKTKEILSNGFKTFAIGFGSSYRADDLNAIAANGGTTISTYIPAGDQQALQDALDTITSTIASCSYDVVVPGNATSDEVNFYFDGAVVVWDQGCVTGNGWSWTDPSNKNEVEFCSQACDRMLDADLVTATFGCPSVVP